MPQRLIFTIEREGQQREGLIIARQVLAHGAKAYIHKLPINRHRAAATRKGFEVLEAWGSPTSPPGTPGNNGGRLPHKSITFLMGEPHFLPHFLRFTFWWG